MATAGRTAVHERYNARAMAEQTLHVLQSLVAE
jgi:hypothetical protein